MKTLVIGGGIGGLTVAVALQEQGIEAHVYEAADALRPVGAGIWVPTNALQALARLGLSEAVGAHGIPLAAIQLLTKEGQLLETIDLQWVEAEFGYTTVSIHRARLQEVLAGALRPGTLHLGRRCSGIRQDADGVSAYFDDGSDARGEVLVGADGIRSTVRAHLFPEARLRYSGQTCYRGIARTNLPGDLHPLCREIWGGESRFGFSAIGPEEVYWFAPVSAPAGQAPGNDPVSALAARYREFPEPVPALIGATRPEDVLLTDLYDLAPLARYWQGRVVLLGDAAHAMTPNLGQGGAQAIEDGVALARQLARTSDPTLAFHRYQQRRLPRARRLVLQSWWLGQVAHLRPRWLRHARNRLLQWLPENLARARSAALYTPAL